MLSLIKVDLNITRKAFPYEQMLDLCSLKPLLAALAHRISCPVVIFPHVGVM